MTPASKSSVLFSSFMISDFVSSAEKTHNGAKTIIVISK
jgi:hypothetical protein